MLGWLADLLLASEREGNPTSGRQATPFLAPHVASESPFQVNSPRREARRAGHLLWRGPRSPTHCQQGDGPAPAEHLGGHPAPGWPGLSG